MNSVLYWNSVLLEVSRRDFTRGFVNSQNPGPIGTSRAMAMVHLAIREALALPTQAASSYYSPPPPQGGPRPPAGPAQFAYLDDVVAGAASGLLQKLYPGSIQYIEDSTSFTSMVAFNAGKAIGDFVFADRDKDGAFKDAAGNMVPVSTGQAKSIGYGDHRADPYDAGQSRLGPRWGEVRHFAPPPLPALPHAPLAAYPGSALQGTPGGYLPDDHYKADYKEVRNLGSVGH